MNLKMKCDHCGNQLNASMKAAFKNDECPFCGDSILTGDLAEMREQIILIIEGNDVGTATNMIMSEYVIPRLAVQEIKSEEVKRWMPSKPPSEIVVSNKDLEESITSAPDSAAQEYLEVDEDIQREDEEVRKLLEEGNPDAFFGGPEASSPARSLQRPPAPPRSEIEGTGDVKGAVMRAHRDMGGDIPEGFEDPSLLPKKGSSIRGA